MLSTLLEGLYNKTTTIISNFEMASFEQLEEVSQLRSELIEWLQLQSSNPLTVKQKEMLQEILGYDDLVFLKMNQLKQEAARQLGGITQAKRQKDAYEFSGPNDSFLFDRRK
ncbi:hypothetical protein IDH44_11530 [Paenibacillus sp. IB182496]|uniref:Flagellar protein FliT n=1 Tax=Paenibacillus sabuli TaxID=2772509 RepID=A0A927GRS8_9BACL|nr:hypothetical protein [Paenibacillus sabuli]MBD2845823.1 hypothetical protein [Paenibacillus sabuli]